jgi:hypothetical protein
MTRRVSRGSMTSSTKPQPSDLVDVDVLLDLIDDGICFTSGGGIRPGTASSRAMPTMPSAPMTLISPVGHETSKSGSNARPAMT